MVLGIGLGLGLKVAGALLGGRAGKKASKAQARAATLNAQQIRERADIETTLRQREGEREAGTIAAVAGVSGLAGGIPGAPSGSAADILRESVRNTLFDVRTIKTQSELQAQVFEQEAKGARSAGRAALVGGVLRAGALLLGRGA